MLRCVVLSIVLLAAEGSAEMLPQYQLESVCLRARLIVEARRVAPGVVDVLRVHHGDAKAGDRLTLRHFEDLPQRAYDEIPLLEEREGIALDGCTTVLFLEPATEGGFEPVGWGSGVKWIVADRVFGHVQPMNPGDYVLVPDDEAESLDQLRQRIGVELELRREFESHLVLLEPKERARALLPYAFRVPRDAYAWVARQILLQIGDAAGAVLVEETGKPRTRDRDDVLAELLGRLRYPGGESFIGRLFDEQTPRIRKLPGSPTDSEKDALYRWQRTVYWLAEVAGPWTGASRTRLLEALRWAVKRRDPEVLESAARGLARAPDPGNVPALAKALADWPSGAEGRRPRSARQALVQCLGDHRLPACVPVLAGLLRDPDPERSTRGPASRRSSATISATAPSRGSSGSRRSRSDRGAQRRGVPATEAALPKPWGGVKLNFQMDEHRFTIGRSLRLQSAEWPPLSIPGSRSRVSPRR